MLHCGSIRQAVQVMSMVELDPASSSQDGERQADDPAWLNAAALAPAMAAAAVLQHCPGALSLVLQLVGSLLQQRVQISPQDAERHPENPAWPNAAALAACQGSCGCAAALPWCAHFVLQLPSSRFAV